MNDLARLFRAERIKWRKNWVLVAAILAPICQAGNLFMILWFSEGLVRRFRPGFEFWFELNYLAWNLVFMPILVALVCDLSWELELESKTWNLLLAQPVPRRTHFLAKLLSHVSLLLLSQTLLVLLLIPGGYLLRGHLGWMMGDFAPGVLLRFAGFACLASIPLVAFHTWLSARLPGLGIALLTALGGSWLCSRLAGISSAVQVLPWGMAGQVVAFFDRLNRHIPWEYFPGALLAAAVLAWLGTVDFARSREPKH
jgi:ABC-2 type transport system permease protein